MLTLNLIDQVLLTAILVCVVLHSRLQLHLTCLGCIRQLTDVVSYLVYQTFVLNVYRLHVHRVLFIVEAGVTMLG